MNLAFSLVQKTKRADKAKISALKKELLANATKLLPDIGHIFPPNPAENEEKAWPSSQASAPKRKTKIIPNKIELFIIKRRANRRQRKMWRR